MTPDHAFEARLLDAWHAHQVIESHRTAATWRQERATVVALWRHAGAHPAQVTPAHLHAFLHRPPAAGNPNAHGPVLAPGVRALYARRILRLYRHWAEQGLLEVNPLRRVRAPSPVEGPARDLTRSQVARIVAHVEAGGDRRDRAVVWLLYSGFRRAEVADARAEDLVTDADASLHVVGKGTDGGKQRTVPLHPHVAGVLDELLDGPDGRRTRGPLIPNYRLPGQHLRPASVWWIFTRAVLGAGVRATPHQLRHSFATHLVDEGVSVAELAELLGHASERTTSRYTKGARKRLRTAVGVLPVACAAATSADGGGHRVAERPPRPAPTVPPPRREPGVRCRSKPSRRRR